MSTYVRSSIYFIQRHKCIFLTAPSGKLQEFEIELNLKSIRKKILHVMHFDVIIELINNYFGYIFLELRIKWQAK